MADRKYTEEEQLYEEMRQAWTEWPIGAPRTAKSMKLFKYYFPTKEHVHVAKHVECRMQGQRSLTAAQIAKECGMEDNIERVTEILTDLLKHGVILSQESKDEPGVLKYVHLGMWGILTDLGVVGKDDIEGIKSRQMVNAFNSEQGEREWTFSAYPWLRTLVVDKNIGANEKILTHELASEIIKVQDKIAIGWCSCRVKRRNCDHRIDTCIFLGSAADSKVDHSKVIPGARPVEYVTQEVALKRIEDSIKEGLVPTTYNNTDPHQVLVICMCCPCCCIHLRSYVAANEGDAGNPYAIQKSNFQPQIDPDKCRLCLTCVGLCPVNAIWHHWPHKRDLSDDFIFFEDWRCLGCGICAYNCPNEAITMKRVSDVIPEPDLPSQFKRMRKEARH